MIHAFLWNNAVSTLQKINICYNKQLLKGVLIYGRSNDI